MNQLKVAQQKFVDSKEAIKKLNEKKGKVPFTTDGCYMYFDKSK